jgi:hypothetical protein
MLLPLPMQEADALCGKQQCELPLLDATVTAFHSSVQQATSSKKKKKTSKATSA